MSNQQFAGLLPLTGYNFVVPTPDGSITPAESTAFQWFPVWHPGYGLFKYKLKDASVKEGWDYAIIEMGGMYHSMYDFCGGIMTSSLKYNVLPIQHNRPFTGWGDRNYQPFREGYFPMVPLLGGHDEGNDTLVKTEPDYEFRLSKSIWGDGAREWLWMYGCFRKFIDYIPDADPYLGPDCTHKQLIDIARNSVFAWLMFAANSNMRTAIVAADRTTNRPHTRNVLKLGSVSTSQRFSTYPLVGLAMDTRDTSPTKGTAARLWHGGGGRSGTLMKYRTKARFHSGQSFGNRNSGNKVSVSTTVVPSGEYGSHVPGINIPLEEWKRLSNVNYIRLFPNAPFHNG